MSVSFVIIISNSDYYYLLIIVIIILIFTILVALYYYYYYQLQLILIMTKPCGREIETGQQTERECNTSCKVVHHSFYSLTGRSSLLDLCVCVCACACVRMPLCLFKEHMLSGSWCFCIIGAHVSKHRCEYVCVLQTELQRHTGCSLSA